MSKLTQIESALLALDGATFQQLCDVYLHRRGYEGINPLGRVIGKHKVARGTPDTWIPQQNGKYLFAEYTTTTDAAALATKLREDLAKCADEAKTGLAITKIQEVIFCHTAVLKAGDEDALISEAQQLGLLVTPIGIGPIAHDLYQKYPGIARDFLGVEVDTGQIVHPAEFIELYGRNPLATPLDTAFLFRAEEVEQVLDSLDSGNLVILSGRPGVGKSRLALHSAERYVSEHPDWELNCIYNRGADLFEDLRVHFSAPGNYLILVDDANRLSGFDYLLQLLRDHGREQNIKLIVTVRDYALPKIREALKHYASGSEIEIPTFKEEEIKELVKEAYGIQNGYFLERIADIAQGNPRLAVMAARVCRRENTFDSIRDVTVLYDEYYATIRQDLDGLADKLLLKAAGILAVIRIVDRANTRQMDQISAAFNVVPDAFWSAVERLHEMEMVDMYENELVKTSDQVLATYLFYLAFFRERGVLQVEALLDHYYPNNRHLVMDALLPVYGAFGAEVTSKRLQPAVTQARKTAAEAGDHNKLLHLMDDFWFINSADVLLFARQQILGMQAEPRGELNVNYKNPPPQGNAASVGSVLSSFRYAPDAERRIALNLLLEYVTRKTSELPHVLRHLIERFGFRHVSSLESYVVEHTTIDAVIDHIDHSSDPVAKTIFFVVAKAFLRTKFRSTESKRGNILVVYDFTLAPSAPLANLRRKLWQKALELASDSNLGEFVGLLGSYIKVWHHGTASEIISEDAGYLLPFVENHLSPSDYTHCRIVQEYLNLLQRNNVPFQEHLRTHFRNEMYALSELFRPDWSARRELGWEDYEESNREKIGAYCAEFGEAEYTTMLQCCLRLMQSDTDQSTTFQLRGGVQTALLLLAEQDPKLYCLVLRNHLEIGNPVGILDIRLVDRLISASSIEQTYSLLNGCEYDHKRRSLFDFYTLIPPKDITTEWLEGVLRLFEEARGGELPYDFSFLTRYSELDPNIIKRTVEILVCRAEKGEDTTTSLEGFYNSHNPLSSMIPTIFHDSSDLLKRAYLVLQQRDKNLDYDGKIFNMILDCDSGFAKEYIEYIFSSHVPRYKGDGPSAEHDNRNYRFLWERVDHIAIMDSLIQRLYVLERGKFMWHSYMHKFFQIDPHEATTEALTEGESISQRQDQFLHDQLTRRSADSEFMQWLFDIISVLPVHRRKNHIATFLSQNTDFQVFSVLQLETIGIAEGSLVPVYQQRVDFLESLLPLFNQVHFLEHRQHVERAIHDYRLRIAQEKRNDFMGR